ncbi:MULTISPECIES: hypothetical protein [Pseudomonas]|uniref:Uncharacterized protein n=1 Tax=Pseudomonas putida (strain GB-1) TaxID=76869 RepID=B0KI86_PSEPG|nr:MULTISPECIES: hypothetical protein [Pseudomonas]ABY97662.1 hypothetical protein PputGB1_1759 [Pseudomonas putida GB-1]MCK2190228.1 hypothetical protein [Pseudomonas sp. MB04B]MDD2087831.1 hypothetical protein [Pseudomonas putida]MDD2097804.1 hypothetical protein [Pseudomonas putida]
MTIYAGDAPALDRRTLLDVPADSGDIFGAAFDEAFSTNPSTSAFRLEELNQQELGRAVVAGPESYLAPNAGRLEPETPLIGADQARDQVAGAGLDIKIPDQGIRQGALDILMQRHQEQLARQQIMARANGGSLPTKIAGSLAASLLDPLNIASAFVPVVGEARYARLLAGATSPLGRAGVRGVVGALEGSVGAAILEPLPLLAAQQDQTEYGLSDSLANIALGGVLGGGLHSVGGAVSDALRRRMATEAAPVETSLNAGATARPADAGRSIDLGRMFDEDPDLALRTGLSRQLEADQVSLYRSAEQQALDEIRPSLTGERVGNVADLKAERIGLVAQDMALDATYRERAKVFQAQRMSRKQAERAARDSIAAERQQIRARNSEIDTMLERNRAGELDRRDLGLIERGQVPDRLQPQIQARARQIMQGYQQRPLGAAIRTARETAEGADWTIRDNALRTAVAQAMSGRDIDVAKLFELDEPAKAASALEYLKRPQTRRVDPEGEAESRRVDGQGQAADDLEDARAALAEDEALAREMLEQLPEGQRAQVEALGRDEMAAADAEAAKAQQYAKAYRAAAICELGRG